MTPSQHHRNTSGTPRTYRRAFPTVFLATLLGGTLALSACGAQEAGAAAIVNGVVVRDQDVQIVSNQLNVLIPDGQQKLSPSDILYVLILAPYVSDEAKRVKKTVSSSEARKAIPAKVADPSPATVEFVRMNLATQRLDPTSGPFIVSRLRKAKITVNPRYGTFDAEKLVITSASPNWIKAGRPSVDPNSNPPVPAK